MHKNCVRLGHAEQFVVDLVGPEDFAALGFLGLLSHAGPGIGVDDVRIGGGFRWIVRDRATSTSILRALRCPSNRRRFRFVLRRSSDPNMRAQLRPREHQRVRDVISVTDEGHLQSGNLALQLQHREVVRHRLAGMAVVREAIDNRDAGILRHLLDNLVSKSSDHDALDHPLQILGHVIHRFPLAKIDLRRRQVE